MAYSAAKNDSIPRTTSGAANSNTADQDNLSVMARRAGQRLSGAIGSAYTNTSQTAEAVTREIRNRPVQSSIIALGLGYVLAAVFRR